MEYEPPWAFRCQLSAMVSEHTAVVSPPIATRQVSKQFQWPRFNALPFLLLMVV